MGVLYWNRVAITDWFRLRNYHPPASIARLADQDTFKPYTRHLFYLNRPKLLNSVDSFRQHCPESPDTIVLGCYHPDQNGIYIYNVQDATLAGVQQVTAAHEVLHSIYARLSGSERKQLNKELQDFYKHGLTDPRVKAEVKLYQATEPGSVMDEMSCTFGTEVADLPPALEAYYAKYFSNRSAIVAFEMQYESEFTGRMAAINDDDKRLNAMKTQINNEETSLATQLAQITAQRNRLNSLLSSGDAADYNNGVDSFNALVSSYNSGLSQLQQDIRTYNQLVQARNQLAGQLTTLDKALDTRLTTQTSSR